MADNDVAATTDEGWIKRIIRRFATDDLFREVAINSAASVLNFGLFILNGIFGFLNSSRWSQSMAFYFLVLAVMTMYVAACIGKPKGRSARTVMRRCGACILILGIAVAALMTMCVIGREVICLSVGLGWILTIITLACVGLAIFCTYQYRNADMVRHAFQRVSLASASGSLLMLEVQTVGTYGQSWDMNVVIAIETVSTIIIVSLLVVFGIALIRKADEVEDIAF